MNDALPQRTLGFSGRRWLPLCAIVLMQLVGLAGCGGGGGGSGASTPGPSPTPTPVTLQSIAVTPTQASVAAGDSVSLAATATYSDGTHTDVTTQVAWSSSTTSIATVGTVGSATGAGAGTATLTASLSGLAGSMTLTVTPATLTSISIAPTNSSLAAGTSQTFTATGLYSDNTSHDLTSTLVWTSSNPSIATVSAGGTATAIAPGNATIQAACPTTAPCGSLTASATLTVTAPTLVSIAVTPSAATLVAGNTQQFAATGTYSDGSTQVLTARANWTSDTPAAATISNAAGSLGLATGVAAGSTHVTAAVGLIASPAVTLTVTASSPVGGAIKYHPGWYIALDPHNNTVSSWIATMHSLKGTPNLVGFFLIQDWIWFEPGLNLYTSGTGDTATGFAALDALLEEAAADGFQFMVGLEGKAFGGTPCSGTCGVVPGYFTNLVCADGAPGYLSGTAVGGTTFSVKSYDPAVTARYVALLQAYGQRYDSNPNFEMFRDATESVNSLFTSAQEQAMPARYIAWAQAGRQAFPHTNLSLSTNFLHSAKDLATLFAGVVPYGIFIGGPDTKAPGLNPNDNYAPGNGNFDGISNIVFNGYIGTDGLTASAVDYRGKLGWISETQTPEETYNQQTPLDTYDAMFGVTAGAAQGGISYGGDMQPQYFIFSFGFFMANPWTQADVTNFIAAGHPVNATAPSSMLAQP